MGNGDKMEISFEVLTAALQAGMDQAMNVVKNASGQITSSMEKTTGASEAASAAVSQMSKKAESSFAGMGASAKAMASSVAAAGKEVKAQLESITGAMNRVHQVFSLVAEIAMVGFIGDKIIETAAKTGEYAHQMELASQKTGMGVETLQALKYAADMSGVSFEQFEVGLRKLSVSMLSAEGGGKKAVETFQAIGLSAEQLKGMKLEDVILKVADAFHSHADGAEKVAIAQSLLGRAGMNLIPLLNQGAEGFRKYMEEAKQAGVIMSENDTEAAAAFELKSRALHAQLQAVTREIGQGLIPVLSSLAGGLSEVAGKGNELHPLREIIKSIALAVAELIGSIASFSLTLGAVFASVNAVMNGVDKALSDAVHGRFSQAKDDLAAMKTEISSIWDTTDKTIKRMQTSIDNARSTHTSTEMEGDLFKKKDKTDKSKPAFNYADTSEAALKGKGAESSMQDWHAELEQEKLAYETRKAIQGEFIAWSTAQDKAFWEGKLIPANNFVEQMKREYGAESDEYKTAMRDRREVSNKIAADELRMLAKTEAQKRGLSKALGDREIEDARASLAMKRELLQQGVAQGQISKELELSLLKKYTEEEYALQLDEMSKELALLKTKPVEYEKMLNEIVKLQEKFRLDMQKLQGQGTLAGQKVQVEGIDTRKQEALQPLAVQKEKVQVQYEGGEISKKKELEAIKEITDQEYQVELQTLLRKQALYGQDTEQYKKTVTEIEALNAKHSIDMLKVTGQLGAESKKEWQKIFDPITKAFETAITGIIQGTTTLQNALRNIGQSIVLEFINNVIHKIVSEWIAGEFQKLASSEWFHGVLRALHLATATEEVTTAATAATAKAVIKKAEKADTIATDAPQAAAGAYKAVVGIPIIGPILAPIAAGVAFAAVTAFGKQGYDIGNENPIVQAHAREMILPANLSEKIRSMVDLSGVMSQITKTMSAASMPGGISAALAMPSSISRIAAQGSMPDFPGQMKNLSMPGSEDGGSKSMKLNLSGIKEGELLRSGDVRKALKRIHRNFGFTEM